MSVLKEFRDFILKGNMFDIAIGVIIAGAFAAVVSSLTKNLINPIIGLVAGKVSFENLFLVLKAGDGGATDFASVADATAKHATVLAYGQFITDLANFVILGAVVFAMVKIYKKVAEKPKPPDEGSATPALTTDQVLLGEIRDLLKGKEAS
jgi:large conductance mechanosensitive channel